MLNFFKKLQKPTNQTAKQPANQSKPNTKQRHTCARLGLEITPDMGYRYVAQMIEEALQNPKLKAIEELYISEEEALMEDEEREEYGNALIDERNKWEQRCVPGDQHLVIYKKGKTPHCDIVEFDFAEIDDSNKPYLKIGAMIPKIFRKPSDGGLPYLEWDKEIIFRPKQILEVKKLKQPIDMNDVELYDGILEKAQKLVEKHQPDLVK
ncbi:MAG: hypothetical protein K0A94_04695 [Desulfuromonadales bacterium]|nr:hypothetical protein [Desulfuromonadales bacterium]